jgi:tetrahydromethanopterin S-methyltransferase subunit G
MRDFTLGSHAARLDTIDARLASIEKKVDALVTSAEQRRGAWKVAAAIGAGVSAGVAFVIKLLVA